MRFNEFMNELQEVEPLREMVDQKDSGPSIGKVGMRH